MPSAFAPGSSPRSVAISLAALESVQGARSAINSMREATTRALELAAAPGMLASAVTLKHAASPSSPMLSNAAPGIQATQAWHAQSAESSYVAPKQAWQRSVSGYGAASSTPGPEMTFAGSVGGSLGSPLLGGSYHASRAVARSPLLSPRRNASEMSVPQSPLDSFPPMTQPSFWDALPGSAGPTSAIRGIASDDFGQPSHVSGGQLDMTPAEHLQFRAVDFLRERRALLAASKERESRLSRQSRELAAAQARCGVMEGEESAMGLQLERCERRALDAERTAEARQIVLHELHLQASSSEEQERELDRQAAAAEVSVRDLSSASATLARHSSEADAELRALRERLRDTTTRLHDAQSRSQSEIASMERGLRIEQQRVEDAEAELNMWRLEGKASEADLRCCHDAMRSRALDIGPSEAETSAAERAEHHAQELESEASQLSRKAARVQAEATEHVELRAALDASAIELRAQRGRLARALGLQAQLETEINSRRDEARAHAIAAGAAVHALDSASTQRAADLAILVRHQDGLVGSAEAAHRLLREEVDEVHQKVQIVHRELQNANAELPVARARFENCRSARDAAASNVQDVNKALEARWQHTDELTHALATTLDERRLHEKEMGTAAAEHQIRLDAIARECDMCHLEAAEIRRSRSGHVRCAEKEVSLRQGVESELRASSKQLDATAASQRAELAKETAVLECQVAALGHRHTSAMARSREIRAVLKAVNAEHAVSQSHSERELHTLHEATAVSHADGSKRVTELKKEGLELSAKVDGLRERSSRLEALNASLRVQVCLLREQSGVASAHGSARRSA